MSHQEGVGETVAPHPPRRRTSKKHNLPKKTALRRCTITAQPGQAHSEQTQTSSSRFLSWSRGVRLGLATYTLPAAAVHLIGAHSPAPLGGAVLLLSPVDEEQGGEDEHNRHRHAAGQPDPDICLQAYRKHTSVFWVVVCACRMSTRSLGRKKVRQRADRTAIDQPHSVRDTWDDIYLGIDSCRGLPLPFSSR